jgi:hypothetical protein
MASIKSLIESGRYWFPVLEDDSAEHLRKPACCRFDPAPRTGGRQHQQVWIDL